MFTRRQVLKFSGMSALIGAVPLGFKFLAPDILSRFVPFSHRDLGEDVAVAIDKDFRLVKRSFGPDVINVGGRKSIHPHHAEMFYSNEKRAYELLQGIKSPYIAKNVKFNDADRSMIMPYLGPDLFSLGSLKWQPSHVISIERMYEEYFELGIFKGNISRPNLFLSEDGTHFIANDFKWIRERREKSFIYEVHLLNAMSAKIPMIDFAEKVRYTFYEFDPELVRITYEVYNEDRISRSRDRGINSKLNYFFEKMAIIEQRLGRKVIV
ncbi:MAG: hypothetical protein AB7H97_14745 [Pseudobdellovibrionaceae bacterium]